MKRRFFLLASPAIVAAPSLMRVSAAVLPSPQPATFMAKYAWKQASVTFHLESNGVHDWWTRQAATNGYAPSEMLPLMRQELDRLFSISRSIYGDGNGHRYGIAALLSEKDYAALTDDSDWDE